MGKKFIKGLSTFLLGVGVGCSQSFLQVTRAMDVNGVSVCISTYYKKIGSILAERLEAYSPLLKNKYIECVRQGKDQVDKLNVDLWDVSENLQLIVEGLSEDEDNGIRALAENREEFLEKSKSLKQFSSSNAIGDTFVKTIDNLIYFDDDTTKIIKDCMANRDANQFCKDLLEKSAAYLAEIKNYMVACDREVSTYAKGIKFSYDDDRKDILSGKFKKTCPPCPKCKPCEKCKLF